MSQHTPLDYAPTDPVISAHFSPFSPSASRARPSTSASQPQAQSARVQSAHVANETAPLLGAKAAVKKPFYRPRPLW